MFFDFFNLRSTAFFSESQSAYASGWPVSQPVRVYRRLFLRPDPSLPFYCRPINLFLISWLIMLFALSFRISYDSYPSMGLPILLFVISLIALLIGYSWFRSDDAVSTRRPPQFLLNVTLLRKFNDILAVLAIAIMLLNLKLEGLPPVLGFFSFDTKVYLEYGRFKQLLFPVLITIVVNSFLDPSRFRKILFSGFGLLSLLLYVTRGGILGAIMQSFFVFTMMSRGTKKRLALTAVLTVVGLAVIADVVGNNRTTQSGFLAFLQIRSQFWEWPMIFLWAISYFSIPLSNLCWIVHSFHFHTVTLAFLYPALPSFLAPTDPHQAFVSGSSHIIDNVHTYLAPYFMDFSYAGLFLANFVLGAACAILKRLGISRNFLTSAVFLGCVADIFFNDNFVPLSTLLQFALQAWAQRYLLSPTRPNQAEASA